MVRWWWVSCLVGCSAPAEVLLAPSQASTNGGTYDLRFEPEPQPFLAGEAAAFRVEVRHEGEVVPSAELAIEPWMPDMGHGLSDPVDVVAEGDGWQQAQLTFSMPGYWELALALDGPPGLDELTIAYEVE